jgi:hypothetical protein
MHNLFLVFFFVCFVCFVVRFLHCALRVTRRFRSPLAKLGPLNHTNINEKKKTAKDTKRTAYPTTAPTTSDEGGDIRNVILPRFVNIKSSPDDR